MGILDEWPEFGPDTQIKVDITSGVLSIISPSKLLNYASYGFSPAEVKASVWKNGSKAIDLSISSTDGAITGSTVSVAQNDTIEVRIELRDTISTPWWSRAVMRRTCFLTVPAGNQQFTFDSTNNRMPIPAWDLAFGWDGNNKLKLGFKVVGDDSAPTGEDLTVKTRLLGPCPDQNASTVIDLQTTTVQTHISAFTKSAVVRDCEVEFFERSGSGTTRQEDRFWLVFVDRDEIPSYPGDPPNGTKIQQTKVGTGAKWTKV